MRVEQRRKVLGEELRVSTGAMSSSVRVRKSSDTMPKPYSDSADLFDEVKCASAEIVLPGCEREVPGGDDLVAGYAVLGSTAPDRASWGSMGS